MDKKDTISEIVASEVTIQVTDQETGKPFERVLPLSYYENSNGIILRGENMNAVPSEIVFYSNTAMNKITDLIGKGPDEGKHEHE